MHAINYPAMMPALAEQQASDAMIRAYTESVRSSDQYMRGVRVIDPSPAPVEISVRSLEDIQTRDPFGKVLMPHPEL